MTGWVDGERLMKILGIMMMAVRRIEMMAIFRSEGETRLCGDEILGCECLVFLCDALGCFLCGVLDVV